MPSPLLRSVFSFLLLCLVVAGLALAEDGLKDSATGIRGWNQKADVGLQPIGRGLCYLCVDGGAKGKQTADLTLHRWTGVPAAPFVPATPADLAAW